MTNSKVTGIPEWAQATPEEWNNWQWQLSNRITSVDGLARAINLSAEEKSGITESLGRLRMAITPYYASLMDPDDPQCPIRRQAVPLSMELQDSSYEMEDPLHEDVDSPVPGLTHRYPDRVLLLVTDQCSMYCRHCTRRRYAGGEDRARSRRELEQALEYIKENRAVRDVLLSGGDSLCISDGMLDDLLSSLRQIKHVEIIRIGTRTPVVMPQRITPELCKLIARYHPVWLNTHFNHPKEITGAARTACARLVDAGIPVGNQTVLLRGVNDCPQVIKFLNHRLLEMRVRPYYMYQCDLSPGIEHFRTSVSRGVEIIELLRGHTSGLAVPTYVVDAPGGGGKIPVSPQYLISMSEQMTVLRNYEGVISAYPEPVAKGEPCTDCTACRHFSGQDNIGLQRLFNRQNISLTPRGNIRERRRREKNFC